MGVKLGSNDRKAKLSVVDYIKTDRELLIATVDLLLHILKKQREMEIDKPVIIERLSTTFSDFETNFSESIETDKKLSEELRIWTYKTYEYEKEKNVSVLRQLINEGYLTFTEIERYVVCPVCGSPSIRALFICPFCGSFKVNTTEIVQHTVCGFTDAKVKFWSKDELVCPSCGLRVKEEDLKILGRIFICENCNRTFRNPSIRFECLNYNTTLHSPKYKFDPLESKVRKIYGYNITKKGERLIFSDTILIDALSLLLSSYPDVIIFRGGDTKNFMEETFKIKELEFSAIIIKGTKAVALDVVGEEAIPFLVKAGVVSRTSMIYLLIVHPDSLRTLADLEKMHSNVRIVNALELSLDKLKDLVVSILSN
ncbi:MAG: hypothetical protein JHC28_00050 [Thermoprotei archaeon]|nr:hypothetical protein [Thermoprotei archaeon]